MSSPRGIGGIVGLVVLVVLLVSSGGPRFPPNPANTGCPGSTNAFGTQSVSGDCTITSNTVWGNGTLTIAGSLYVNGGVTLTLWNLVVKFSQTADLQHVLSVGGTLVVRWGGLQSNDAYHWSLSSSGRVDLQHTNVSNAGSGATAGLDILGGANNIVAYSRISGSRVRMLSGHNDYFAFNNVSNYDDSSTGNNCVFWIGANSTVEHNAFWNVTVGTQSVIFIFQNWGNVKIFANDIKYRANGNNAMGVEVRNMGSSSTTVKPTGYLVTSTWNNLTLTYRSGGTNDIPFDNEYSERIYIANNTVSGVTDGCLQGGGLVNSLMENNVCKGAGIGGSFGIYDYIDENAYNIFRNNHFDHYANGLEFQTGHVTVTGNTFANLTENGIWICPNAPCAGSSANTSNNAWYNNTFTFASPGYLTRMDLSNAFYNTLLAHGAGQWTDGTNAHPVYGDWLFFASAPIQHLAFADRSDGHRALSLTSGGATYSDEESLSSVTDNAMLSVDGSLDFQGSVYGNTMLHALNPQGATNLDLMGTSGAVFTMSGFAPSYVYNVSLQDLGAGTFRNGTTSTDGSGFSQFSLVLGATMAKYSITIWGSFPAPPGDTTPPAQVTDLRATAIGPGYAVLAWTAPGNNGSLGRASQYELRYSPSGPLTNATFGQGTLVATPAPGLSGSEESLNVTGLLPNTTYWLALRTADSVPNWSPISNNVKLVTSPPPAPVVQSASLDVFAGAIDVLFSMPMNRSSVDAAIQINGSIPFHLVWLDDVHLQVVFDAPLGAGVRYTLTISSHAADEGGQALGTPFVYTFTGPTTSPSPNSSGTDVVGFAIALGLVSAVILLAVFQDRTLAAISRGTRWLGRSVRRPPRHPPSPPEGTETLPRDPRSPR